MSESLLWWARIRERLDPRVEGELTARRYACADPLPQGRWRVMSFNMQAGMAMTHYRHYVTRSWRHLLSTGNTGEVLDPLAALLRHCDLVCLQEVDGGSLRSGFINQLQHLAREAGFHYTCLQVNRDLGQLGQYSNGLLARMQPRCVEEHQLPGLRGRGAILAHFGEGENRLLVVNLHLALTGSARRRQLDYVRQRIDGEKRILLMGDLNCSHEDLLDSPLGDMDWQWTYGNLNTYPSWQPVRRLDHILASSSMHILQVNVPDIRLSDHRPVLMDLQL